MLVEKWVLRAALLALAAVEISFALLLHPAPVRGDVIACTGNEDSRPARGAECLYNLGTYCYVCDYAYDGGAEVVCSETPDGEVTYCKPYDDGSSSGPPKV
jgi:hypothetical protein